MKNTIEFIGIGFERCGTTWIGRCLEEHPQILFSSKKSHKELEFFFQRNSRGKNIANNWGKESNYNKGINWYLNQFPSPQKDKIRGEFSPYYICSKKALQRIKKHFPNVKIIIALRNPVKRIYSLYCYYRQSVRVRINQEFDQIVLNRSQSIIDLDKGLYYVHLRNAFDIFSPENIHIIFFEQIKKDPEKVLKHLYSFLEVNFNFKPSVLYKKVNYSNKVERKKLKAFFFQIAKWMSNRQNTFLPDLVDWLFQKKYLYRLYRKVISGSDGYPKMQDRTKRYLQNLYKKDIMKTEKLLKKDLNNWYSS